ncbi:UDP-2,3-diacylglucosamine diphosphatase [Flaviaesturariibacter amylovorans]|uniref:UDP-2,3-diacylglucosamine diphosphatase n=1 Tax=Flaviaesturariibacter amylovorans TaxID=1084520 RepID=A0ABP8GB63_9BACT
MQLPPGKKVYFLSDFHLGAPDAERSRERERLIVRFLEEARQDAAVIFIVGDVFDFWYEYKYVVPKGYTRLLGKWAEIVDSGIPIHFFVGNHDMWMRDYFQTELGTPVYYEAKEFTFNNKLFHIAHGDGLGPGDHGYKALKKLFRNPVAQWGFGILPPRIGIGLADYFSRKSRGGEHSEEVFHGADNEWLITYSREVLQQKKVDYFVFGHRHLPIDFRLSEESRYLNLGDWVIYFTYAVFDGTELELKSYTGQEHKIVRG